jgi:hypothetical protein
VPTPATDEFAWLTEARAAEATAKPAEGAGFAPPDVKHDAPKPVVAPATQAPVLPGVVTALGLRRTSVGFEVVRFTIEGELISKEERVYGPEPSEPLAFARLEEEVRLDYMRRRLP